IGSTPGAHAHRIDAVPTGGPGAERNVLNQHVTRTDGELVILQRDPGPGRRLAGDRHIVVVDRQVALERDHTGNLKNDDARPLLLAGPTERADRWVLYGILKVRHLVHRAPAAGAGFRAEALRTGNDRQRQGGRKKNERDGTEETHAPQAPDDRLFHEHTIGTALGLQINDPGSMEQLAAVR